MTKRKSFSYIAAFAAALVLLFCPPAYCRSGTPAHCRPGGEAAGPSKDLIDLSAPRPEYLEDLTPTLRESGLLPEGTMDAELFDRLGGLEKSLVIYMPRTIVPVDALEGAICRSFKHRRREYALIKAMVVNLNKCRYCVGGAVKALRGVVKDEELIQTLLRDPKKAKVSRRERAVLAYAQALTEAPEHLKPDYVEDMRKAGLTDREIFDVAMLTSWVNFLSRLGAGLRYSLDPGRQVLDKQVHDKDYRSLPPEACAGTPEWPPTEGRE